MFGFCRRKLMLHSHPHRHPKLRFQFSICWSSTMRVALRKFPIRKERSLPRIPHLPSQRNRSNRCRRRGVCLRDRNMLLRGLRWACYVSLCVFPTSSYLNADRTVCTSALGAYASQKQIRALVFTTKVYFYFLVICAMICSQLRFCNCFVSDFGCE